VSFTGGRVDTNGQQKKQEEETELLEKPTNGKLMITMICTERLKLILI